MTAAAAFVAFGCAAVPPAPTLPEGAIRVPQDEPTIQAGVDAAGDGGVVIVAPGIYSEPVEIKNKAVTLASWYLVSRDPRHVDATVLQGRHAASVTIGGRGEGTTRVVGLTLKSGRMGIDARHTRVEILDNHILHQRHDGIGLEGTEVLVRGNRIEANSDDGIDCDGATQGVIEDNRILNSGDDGIEMRLHPYTGSTLRVVIRGNEIHGSREDGIQLIDYPGRSERIIRIERNLVTSKRGAGLAASADQKTLENFQGAPLDEPVFVVNNTFAGHDYGLIGGDHMIVVNNIFIGSRSAAIRRLRGESVTSHNLFWDNGRDVEGSETVLASALRGNPRLDGSQRPRAGSSVIDAGVASLDGYGDLFAGPPHYRGDAPDLGAFEVE